MHWNPELNLGTVVELVVFLLTASMALIRVGRLESKLNIMFNWFERAVINGGDQHTEETKRFHGKNE